MDDTTYQLRQDADSIVGEYPDIAKAVYGAADEIDALRERLEAARAAIGLDGAGRLAAMNEAALIDALAPKEKP